MVTRAIHRRAKSHTLQTIYDNLWQAGYNACLWIEGGNRVPRGNPWSTRTCTSYTRCSQEWNTQPQRCKTCYMLCYNWNGMYQNKHINRNFITLLSELWQLSVKFRNSAALCISKQDHMSNPAVIRPYSGRSRSLYAHIQYMIASVILLSYGNSLKKKLIMSTWHFRHIMAKYLVIIIFIFYDFISFAPSVKRFPKKPQLDKVLCCHATHRLTNSL